MRFGLPVIVLVTALLVSAFAVSGGSDTVSAQESEVVLAFEAVGDSGISGTATLTAAGDDVQVVLAVTGLADDKTYLSGSYDASSVTCVGGLLGGGFSATFAAADGGVTYTVEGTVLSDIFSVSVRDVTDTGSPPGTVVACAEQAAGTPTPTAAPTPDATPSASPSPSPTPGDVPPTGGPPTALGDDASTWWQYLLIAGGALALLGGGTLAVRGRRVQ